MSAHGHFEIYVAGLVHASVCTDLPLDEATKRLNREMPTGITSTWKPSKDREFAGGGPQPGPCEQDRARKHYLFSC